MQFDPIAFAATKTFIENKNLVGPPDSSSIAAFASLLGNPVVALFAGQAMAEKKAAEQAAAGAAATAVAVPARQPEGTGAEGGATPPSPPVGATAGGTLGSPQFEKMLNEINTRATEFIARAEKLLLEVKQEAQLATQAANEAKAAALATKAKVEETLGVEATVASAGRWSTPGQKSSKRPDSG